MADVQHERAYQKQKGIYIGPKRVMVKKSKKGSKAVRWYRDIGLGFCSDRIYEVQRYIYEKQLLWKCFCICEVIAYSAKPRNCSVRVDRLQRTGQSIEQY